MSTKKHTREAMYEALAREITHESHSPEERDAAFLLNPRNKAFLDYVEPKVYPPHVPLGVYFRNAVAAFAALGFVLLYLYSLRHDAEQAKSTGGYGTAPDIAVFLWIALTVGLALAGICLVGWAAFLAIKVRRGERLLVEEGHVLLAPVLNCVTQFRLVWACDIYLTYGFISPQSGQEIVGTYNADWWRNRPCPAPGTPLAILYYNDEEFQVL